METPDPRPPGKDYEAKSRSGQIQPPRTAELVKTSISPCSPQGCKTTWNIPESKSTRGPLCRSQLLLRSLVIGESEDALFGLSHVAGVLRVHHEHALHEAMLPDGFPRHLLKVFGLLQLMAGVVVEGVLSARQERKPIDLAILPTTANAEGIHLLVEAVHQRRARGGLRPLLVERRLPEFAAAPGVAVPAQLGEENLVHAAVVCPRPLTLAAALPPGLEERASRARDLQEEDAIVERERVVRKDDWGMSGSLHKGLQRCRGPHDVGVHVVPEDVILDASGPPPELQDALPHHLEGLQLAVAEVAPPTVWAKVRAT
eukprot:CAMPEP_0175240790 /NCGR_PEP_ID=MMETSP0093-20121207/30233_1 /TAXON_ID=311494 /ORGANISM="Alexandrium monilatum, Strain CCMP3105" /LENGTH=314 /DNA_ID=CAMNT_0016534843 /DNA_START=63 /DNA_END=1007 /DNA_ORIENTATION=+